MPIVTPFGNAGDVDLESVERLCHQYLDAGAAGIVALGTTGEAAALDADEKHDVIAACDRVCSDRSATLIVGAGTNNTKTSINAVESLRGLRSLRAVLTVVPYYIRPSEEGIIEHFRAVAKASPAPLVMYNIPYRTGRALGAASLLALAGEAKIAGLKQAVGAIDLDTLEVLSGAPEGFAVLGGDDAYLFPTVVMGGSGAIAAAAHLCTERFVAMIECGLAGKIDEGRAHAEALLPVVKAVFAEPNPAVIKGVLHAQQRIPTRDLRLPMTAASASATQAALAAVEQASR